MSPFKQAAKQLYTAGYSIIPIAPKSKRAVEDGWSSYCDEVASKDLIKKWAKKPDINIGVALGKASGIIALDFDVNVNNLHEKIETLLPESPVKKVGSRGYTVFFKYNKEVNRKWSKNKEVVIELLSSGRQTVVPPSVHPLGGNYEYTSFMELGDVTPDDLPVLPDNFCEELDKLFDIEPDNFVLDAKFEEIQEALDFIEPDEYDVWIQVGMAIKSVFPDDEGFKLWDSWSAKSDKYKESEMARRWRSFKRGGIATATLFYYAIANGYDCRFTDQELRENVMQAFVRLDQVEDTVDLWRAEGKVVGETCGIKDLDNLIHYRKGEVSVWTGYPGNGKSELLDSVAVGLMSGDARWKFAVCSMEKGHAAHYDNLIQKITKQSREDVGNKEYMDAKSFLRDHVILVDYYSLNFNFDAILEQLEKYMKFNTVDAIIIDPFTYLNSKHKVTSERAHTQYVMTSLCNFAKNRDVHIALVAHPTKPDRTFGRGLPRLTQYSISGGADFSNAADLIVAVYRKGKGKAEVEVIKVRDQEIDKPGKITLNFNSETKEYTKHDNSDDFDDFDEDEF